MYSKLPLDTRDFKNIQPVREPEHHITLLAEPLFWLLCKVQNCSTGDAKYLTDMTITSRQFHKTLCIPSTSLVLDYRIVQSKFTILEMNLNCCLHFKSVMLLTFMKGVYIPLHQYYIAFICFLSSQPSESYCCALNYPNLIQYNTLYFYMAL